MKKIPSTTMLGVFAGFVAGLLASNLPSAFATQSPPAQELSNRTFDVSIFEVKKQLTPGDFLAEEFKGSYTRTFTMSDGKQRTVELTPMIHKGMQVIRLKDNGSTTYSSLNGLTLNGSMLVSLTDNAASKARLKAEGWPFE